MTPAQDTLKWLFLDLNSYFASVEQHLNPALRGWPVAVVPVETEATCAIAASYEAKAFGVRTGTMIYEAKRRCPGLKLVRARHEVYVEFHHRIVEEIGRHIPIDKVHSVDEVSCALMGPQRERRNAEALAREIKRGLAAQIGPCIRCSIGLAPNRFLAKVGTELDKPDGLGVIELEDLPDKLVTLDLREFPGIGRNIEKRLHRAGVYDIRTLWRLSPKHARKIWGGVTGERFWYALHGLEIPELETVRRTVGHSHVLAPELRPPEKARLVARRLTIKAASRLRRLGYYAGWVSLRVRLGSGVSWKGEVGIPRALDNFTILGALETLWKDMALEAGSDSVKKVAITLSGLVPSADLMPDLFGMHTPLPEALRARREAVSVAMDRLNKRHGRDTVVLGDLPNPNALFTGAKIAFTRVPDLAEFKE